LEAAGKWGARIEAIVGKGFNKVVADLFNLPPTLSIRQASRLPPDKEPWDGVMLGTVLTLPESKTCLTLVTSWTPLLVVLVTPRHLAKGWREKLLFPFRGLPGYTVKMMRCRHKDVGGVTTSDWDCVHLHRMDVGEVQIMTAGHYERPLQAALMDTIGPSRRKVKFEALESRRSSQAEVVVGNVVVGGGHPREPVYSSYGLGPDISRLGMESREFWVRADSVWCKEQVLRQVSTEELFAVWDYEGKLESKHWTTDLTSAILQLRLGSPPGKIVRALAHAAFSSRLSCDHEAPPQGLIDGVGLTKDVKFSPLEDAAEVRAAAAMGDDREVNLSYWSEPGESLALAKARELCRKAALRFWIRRQERLAQEWLDQRPLGRQDPRDKAAIEDCLRHARGCTYWAWPRGSRIFFWKMPPEWQAAFRDGTPFWRLAEPPRGMRRNPPAPSRDAEVKMRRKVFKLKYQGYLEPGNVKLVIPRFAVPKADDIRVVWDSSINGHNKTLWAPGFMLDSFHDVENMAIRWLTVPVGRYLDEGSPPVDYEEEREYIATVFGDIDISSMFHNFRAHPSDQPFLGVRCYETVGDGTAYEHCTLWRSVVLTFGGRCSPYLACQAQNRILSLVKGRPDDCDSSFAFTRVILNLPCAPDYDASFPRVMKINKDDELAADDATYVDDCRIGARGIDGGKKACSQVNRGVGTYGNQADLPKFRGAGRNSGAWIGFLLSTNQPFPMKSISGKKWARFREGLNWIRTAAGMSDYIGTGELRRIAGLGVHVTEIYPEGRCFLKGFFNALEAFRFGRDEDGWRIADANELADEMAAAARLETDDAALSAAHCDYPPETRITNQLLMHVDALLVLFNTEAPRVVPVRPTDKSKLRYVCGDASAEGFGVMTQYPSLKIQGRDGLWDPKFAEKGSNLREAQAQCNHLLEEIRARKHDGCELWCFTDNAVWSAVWVKGMSSAKHLFNLVVELKVACCEHEVHLRLCHISGDRMIKTGIDGMSRGNQDEGISLGHDIRRYLPLNVGAFEHVDVRPGLVRWCRSWMGNDFSEPLSPMEWFWEGHQPGVHVWAPAPGAALVVLKEIARSRQKRPTEVRHVFLCHRLLWQEEWRSRFEKEFDVWFVLSTGDAWPHSMFEPLLVGISFEMRSERPWLVRERRQEVVAFGSALSKMSKTCHLQVGRHLRELWLQPWNIEALRGSVVRGML